MAAGAAFTAIVRFPNGSRFETRGVQFVGDAGVLDLLLRSELHDQRHKQAL